MGGLASDIGGLFGGSSAKTDRKLELQGLGNLNNVFNFAMPQAEASTSAASSSLGNAAQYYNTLLSGNRAATLQAVAPTVNAANTQTDAAKRQLAGSGTARGGGVNAVTQTFEDQKRANIDNAINQAKAGAAGGATAVGGTLASQANQLLGIGSNAATNMADIAANSRRTSQQLHNDAFASAGDLAGRLVDSLFGEFGPSTTPAS